MSASEPPSANQSPLQDALISYGRADSKEFAVKLQQRLAQEEWRVWLDLDDIPAAVDYQQQIDDAIDRSDNILFIISPHSVNSHYCGLELERALQRRKRIIPILHIRETSRQTWQTRNPKGTDADWQQFRKEGKHDHYQNMRPDIRRINWLLFEEQAEDYDFETAFQTLTAVLKQDRDYVHRHTQLLMQALTWEREHKRSRDLLSGDALKAADRWWKTRFQDRQPPCRPSKLHDQFISESLRNQRDGLTEAFISYGRSDSRDFAQGLTDRLTGEGLTVWFDFNDIPAGVDYQQKIDDAIDKTSSFIFIISPHSINSPYCRKELERALMRHKRIIPLLHVKEISRETWQARNPQGSDTDWQDYRAKGLHDHFQNMPAQLRAINWINCDAQDPYYSGFEGAVKTLLKTILDDDRDYVYQHTRLLQQAVAWQQAGERSRDLLVEDALQDAETWLQTRFLPPSPPYTPTPLHCRFISESLKHTRNGLADVFIIYSAIDEAAQAKIYESLARGGLTVWTAQQRVPKGLDFEDAIRQRIQASDSVVCLLSPTATESERYRSDLRYALALNKRAIPVLVQPTDQVSFPDGLKTLAVVDLTGRLSGETRLVEEYDELLQALDQDKDHYATHKRLLVKALKWKAQERNPYILLRGGPLQAAENWLKLAEMRDRHPPLPEQIDFIQTSLKEPPNADLSVFITSSAKDLKFARQINEALQAYREWTWFKSDEILPGQTDETAVKEAIGRAENCVFVLSKEALTDEAFLNDLAAATALSKRLIAVSYRTLNWDKVPEALATCPRVDFKARGGEFHPNCQILFNKLKSSPKHVRRHTRLLVRALEWEQSGRDDSTLLQRKELQKAEKWLANAKNQSPAVSQLQRDYIDASRQLTIKRIKPRSLLGLNFGAATAALILSLLGLLQGAELAAYDWLLRQRPNEAKDERFLIVTVDDGSGTAIREGLKAETYAPSIGTIPDDALNEALTILDEANPRLIGLDFYRDFDPQPSVKNALENTDNLILICKGEYRSPGVDAPPEIPMERVGFNNAPVDKISGSNFLRRHLLMQEADAEHCDTSVSFSLLLAQRYLDQEEKGLDYAIPSGEEVFSSANKGVQLGSARVPALNLFRGPYHPNKRSEWEDLDTVWGGYQILLNFRTGKNDKGIADPRRFADEVTLEALLNRAVPEEQIKDRIVLIGYTDIADRNTDEWDTPYGTTLPGVFLQGQMTSQLISAALEGRPLLRWWPFWGEALWILGWATVGGIIAFRVIRLPRQAATLGVGLVVIYVSCWGALRFGALWIPLVPPVASFLLAAGSVAALNYRLRNP